MKSRTLAAIALASLPIPAARAQGGGTVGPDVPPFAVRGGYRVTLAADGIEEARFLEFDGDGALYVSRPRRGEVLRLEDRDGDGQFETRTSFVADRPMVHGLHHHDGRLWFTQSGSIHRAHDGDGDGIADTIETVIAEGRLPSGGGHWWRSILVSPEAIYTSIGDSGNITDEQDTERQRIWRFRPDGSNKALFASGIRNTEKLRFRPGTDEVWGIDHGSDWFGRPLGEERDHQPVTDLNPPDEMNHYVEGRFYGHPFVTGDRVPRIEYHDRPDILDLAATTTPPAWKFGAHWAANGFTFLEKDVFGPDAPGDAFVALHGSWNSSVRVGYGVERVMFDEQSGRPFGSHRVVTTLSTDGQQFLARPVDCAEARDGSVLFSCDATGRIYRISPAP